MKLGIVEKINAFCYLDERAWPAVEEKQRNRVWSRRARVHKMGCDRPETVNIYESLKLRYFIETGFFITPGVF